MRRRSFISAVGAVSAATLAGCTDGGSDGDDGDDGTRRDATDRPTDTATPADDTTRSTDATSDDGERDSENGATDSLGPADLASTFLTAEEVATVEDLLHPAFPHRPEDEGEITPYDASDVRTTVVTADAGVDAVLDMHRASEVFSESQLAVTLDGERVAVVEATATRDGEETDLQLAAATHESAWRLLWLAPAGADDRDAPADGAFARAVAEVTFDTEKNRARVQFVDDPVADEVTAEAANARSERTTDTPESFDYVDLSMDPEGDEVRVSATLDGETELVRRERYPPGERTVADVRYELEEPAQAVAELNEVGDVDALTVRATRSYGESTATNGAENLNYLATTMDPDGDEIVVERTVDGETTELHRERYHP